MYTLCQRMVQEGRLIGGILYMKKRWGTPRAVVEEFEANEYVVDQPNPDPMEWNTGQTHSHNSDGKGCGWDRSQYIVEVGNDVFNVTEYGDNILPCKLTRNSQWKGLSSTISDVKPGETIYWTTSLGDRTWYHYGTVGTEDLDHPNRS